MKRISLICCMLLLAGSLRAQDDSDFLRTPRFSGPLTSKNPEPEGGLVAGRVTLSKQERKDLLRAPQNATLHLPSLDKFTGNEPNQLEYSRIELFARGATVHLIGPGGITPVKPGRRHFYLATNEATGIGLAIDPESGSITGFATRGDSKMEISGATGTQLELTALEPVPEGSDSCETRVEDQENFDLAGLLSGASQSLSEAPAGSAISYQAEVAIDTDNEWMAGKGNNTTTAMNFITDIFLAMNVFYERDVETRLLIGQVILRTTPDPYSVATGRSEQLDEFAEYWRVNQGGVNRDFAAMFSGRDIGSGAFSGIAWINQYCQKGVVLGNGRTAGSYSFNAIGSGRTAASTAWLVGHELGHNLGSPHTHCYNPAVDQCYSGESSCYSGPVSCPAGGKGTIMSYCHVSAGSGGAGCGTNKSEFHPTVQGVIEGRLAANTPSCIAPYVPEPPAEPPLFISSFESP